MNDATKRLPKYRRPKKARTNRVYVCLTCLREIERGAENIIWKAGHYHLSCFDIAAHVPTFGGTALTTTLGGDIMVRRSTFDQAREALKLALDYYRSKGTQKFNPYEVEQALEKALAAMEGV